jgi:hypothetical protein
MFFSLVGVVVFLGVWVVKVDALFFFGVVSVALFVQMVPQPGNG